MNRHLCGWPYLLCHSTCPPSLCKVLHPWVLAIRTWRIVVGRGWYYFVYHTSLLRCAFLSILIYENAQGCKEQDCRSRTASSTGGLKALITRCPEGDASFPGTVIVGPLQCPLRLRDESWSGQGLVPRSHWGWEFPG